MAGVALVRLAELAAAVSGAGVVSGADAGVQRVISDSRRARAGDLFVAIPGARTDGALYAADALARGAVGVAVEQASIHRVGPLPPGAGLLVVPHARRALGELASTVSGRPSERLRLVGVTGTDGKTTTCQLIAHILAAAGQRVGWLTTVDIRTGDQIVPNAFAHTTPEAPEIQQTLEGFVEVAVEDAVIEVSSHALALDRVAGCSFDAAVFTNLSPEHLDFHGSMERYAATKARLFEMLDSSTSKRWSRMGIVNADDPASVVMAASSPAGIVSYALDTPADVRATQLHLGLDGTRFRLVTPIGELDLHTRFTGRHNVSNWLAAAAVALGWGIDLTAVVEAAARTDPPTGRFQRIRRGQRFEVIVDFAHTPAALAATLGTLHTLSEGHLLLVFGMAGGRDVANRPKMGEVAARQTDFFAISTDDPAAENPAAIASQIAEGARRAGAQEGQDFIIELDRREAIRSVVRRARPGDAVVLAGKGHERRMLIGERREPWSDEVVAAEVLREIGYG